MTPQEIDLVHLRLHQVGEVLYELGIGKVSRPTLRLIEAIKQGMNTPPPIPERGHE